MGADEIEASPTRSPREPKTARDRYADFLRAFSLIIVILWHWCFTILLWRDRGPTATNPIGFTSGLWIATWLLQVLPLFFYVGGHVHLMAWRRAQARGTPLHSFVLRQVRALAIPSMALLVTWIVLGVILAQFYDAQWVAKMVKLIVSPLWFVGIYLLLIALLPVALWLHKRFDSLVLVWLGGLAMVVDIVRFRYDVEWIAWLNMLFVWGLAYQMGFFHDRIVAAPRRIDWTLTLVGFFGLVGLVFSGLYPGSMVGVPGQGSNMAPPTLCILALVMFQVGVAELARPWVEKRMQVSKQWARVTSVMTRFAMPLFLFHTTGMALSRAVEWLLRGSVNEPTRPDLEWWLGRPLAIVGPLLCTLPVIYLFGRKWTRARPAPAAGPDQAANPDVESPPSPSRRHTSAGD